MLAALTNKELAKYLEPYWEGRFSRLMRGLRSGHAGFEITRYVVCQWRDNFYWDPEDTLNDMFFTVCVDPIRCFARQVVPQIMRAKRTMSRWAEDNVDGGDSRFVVSTYVAPRRAAAGCKRDYHIEKVRIVVSTEPAPFFTGDLDRLTGWLESPPIFDGYSSEESLECAECGE